MHPATYILYAENYGSRAAGRYHYGFQADWKNLGGTGSRLMAGVVISNGKQHGGNLAYEIPVGHSSTTLGLAYSHSDYELGSIWSRLGVEGKSGPPGLRPPHRPGRWPAKGCGQQAEDLVPAGEGLLG